MLGGLGAAAVTAIPQGGADWHDAADATVNAGNGLGATGPATTGGDDWHDAADATINAGNGLGATGPAGADDADTCVDDSNLPPDFCARLIEQGVEMCDGMFVGEDVQTPQKLSEVCCRTCNGALVRPDIPLIAGTCLDDPTGRYDCEAQIAAVGCDAPTLPVGTHLCDHCRASCEACTLDATTSCVGKGINPPTPPPPFVLPRPTVGGDTNRCTDLQHATAQRCLADCTSCTLPGEGTPLGQLAAMLGDCKSDDGRLEVEEVFTRCLGSGAQRPTPPAPTPPPTPAGHLVPGDEQCSVQQWGDVATTPRLRMMSDICCGAAGCSDAPPADCSPECAALFMPFFRDCQSTITRSNSDVDRGFVRFASTCAMAQALHPPPMPPIPPAPPTAQRCQPRPHCEEPRTTPDGLFECEGTAALCQRCELGFHGPNCERVQCANLAVQNADLDCPGMFGGLSTFGTQCQATCHPGLSRVAGRGDGHYICQPDGTWAGSIFCAASAGTQCQPNQFTCSDGVCIQASKVNDGTPDCPDGSDEPRRPRPQPQGCMEQPDTHGQRCSTCESVQPQLLVACAMPALLCLRRSQ